MYILKTDKFTVFHSLYSSIMRNRGTDHYFTIVLEPPKELKAEMVKIINLWGKEETISQEVFFKYVLRCLNINFPLQTFNIKTAILTQEKKNPLIWEKFPASGLVSRYSK